MSDAWQTNKKQVRIDQAWDLNSAFGERDSAQSTGLFQEPAESTVVDSGTGNSKTYKNGVLVEQRLSSKLWTRNLPANVDEARPKPKPPKTSEEIIDRIEQSVSVLADELHWYQANQGHNPNAEAIVRLKLEIAALQKKLNPLVGELETLQKELPPTERIVKVVGDITREVQNLGREAQERKLRDIIETDHDLEYEAADRETKRQILNQKKFKPLRDATTPFWCRFAKGPRLEDLQDAAQRVFEGAEKITNFLRS